MQRFILTSVSFGLVLLTAAPLVADERPVTEKQKIEALIKHIEGLKDATFVRNGRDYDATAAGKFLRGKWDANRSEIQTAKDFIDKAASVSSTTGKPYVIRFKDGREVNTKEHLLAELKKIAKPSDGK